MRLNTKFYLEPQNNRVSVFIIYLVKRNFALLERNIRLDFNTVPPVIIIYANGIFFYFFGNGANFIVYFQVGVAGGNF